MALSIQGTLRVMPDPRDGQRCKNTRPMPVGEGGGGQWALLELTDALCRDTLFSLDNTASDKAGMLFVPVPGQT